MKNKGFTLMEMLIVISIITILLGIAAVNFNRSRKQARDTQRVQIMTGIQAKMEKYYADNGNYPGTMNFCGAGIFNLLASDLPVDPGCSGQPVTYNPGIPGQCFNSSWVPCGATGPITYYYYFPDATRQSYILTLTKEAGDAGISFYSPK